MLNWSKNFFLVIGTVVNQDPIFTITDTRLYVSVVTLSFEGNVKLLKQLESGFKRTTNWNKYQSNVTQQTRYKNLDFLIDPSFQRVNRLFIFSFDDRNIRQSQKKIFSSDCRHSRLRCYDRCKKFL